MTISTSTYIPVGLIILAPSSSNQPEWSIYNAFDPVISSLKPFNCYPLLNRKICNPLTCQPRFLSQLSPSLSRLTLLYSLTHVCYRFILCACIVHDLSSGFIVVFAWSTYIHIYTPLIILKAQFKTWGFQEIFSDPLRLGHVPISVLPKLLYNLVCACCYKCSLNLIQASTYKLSQGFSRFVFYELISYLVASGISHSSFIEIW